MKKTFTSEEVLQEGQKLAQILQNLPEVVYFKQCEKKLRNHKEATRLISEIKQLQKEIVNLGHLEKNKACKQKEDELYACQQKLNAIPLVAMFFQAQEEINELFQNISWLLTQAIHDEIKLQALQK